MKLIPFHNAAIEATQHTDGKIYVSVRRVCEHLGIAFPAQTVKLHDAKWACVTIIATHDATGRTQEQLFLSADCLAFWVATINSKKVAPHIAPLLDAYQQEARDVLSHAFTPEIVEQKQPSSDDIDAMLAAIIVSRREAKELARQQTQLAQQQQQHLQRIEALEAKPTVTLRTKVDTLKLMRSTLFTRLSGLGLGAERITEINRELKRVAGRKRENWELHHFVMAAKYLNAVGINASDILEMASEVKS